MVKPDQLKGAIFPGATQLPQGALGNEPVAHEFPHSHKKSALPGSQS